MIGRSLLNNGIIVPDYVFMVNLRRKAFESLGCNAPLSAYPGVRMGCGKEYSYG